MSLFDKVSEDIKNAMKAHDKVALETLRNVKKCFLEAKTAEGANGELGYYLISDGGRSPYRLHFRRPCFIYYQAYPEMIKGSVISDAIVTMSSMNVIAGELDG